MGTSSVLTQRSQVKPASKTGRSVIVAVIVRAAHDGGDRTQTGRTLRRLEWVLLERHTVALQDHARGCELEDMPAEPVGVVHLGVVLAIELLSAFGAIQRRHGDQTATDEGTLCLVRFDEIVPI